MRADVTAFRRVALLSSASLLTLASPEASAQPPVLSGFEVQATASALQPEVGDRLFHGTGTISGTDTSTGTGIGTGQPANFAAHGRELGLLRPWLPAFNVETCLYLLRHLGIGFRFGFGLGGHADAAPSSPDLAGQVDTGSFNQTQIGAVLRGVLPIASWATVRLSTFLGYRSYGVPITAFDKVSCGRGGTCYPQASSDQFSFEPRVEATLSLGPNSPVALLGFVGAELSPPLAFSAGGGLVFGRHDLRLKKRQLEPPPSAMPPPAPVTLSPVNEAEEPPPDPPAPTDDPGPDGEPATPEELGPPPVLPPVLPPPPVFEQPTAPTPATTAFPPLRDK